jgi:hypothetical protein
MSSGGDHADSYRNRDDQDSSWDRAVKVTVTAPAFEGLNFEELAQRAWRAPKRQIAEGKIAVSLEC